VCNPKYRFTVSVLLISCIEPSDEDKMIWEAWDFCRIENNSSTHSIEVVYRNEDQVETITKVYFSVDLKVSMQWFRVKQM